MSRDEDRDRIPSCFSCICCSRPRPSWNMTFRTTVQMLRTGAFCLPRNVRALRLITDTGLPKCLLPAGVKCFKSEEPPGEWFWPSSELPPRGASPDISGRRCVLYFHGGAFCLCGPQTHRDLLCRLAREAGVPILAVDYRRPPEDPYPASLEDCLAAYLWLLGRTSASRLVLAGDSAGGNLVVATMLACASRQHPMPAGARPRP
jgi:acetyl esterase/lipase